MADVKLRMTMDNSQVRTSTQQVKGWVKGLGADMDKSISSTVGGWFTWGAVAAGAIKVAKFGLDEMKRSMEWGANISDLSKRLDIDPTSLQELAFAAKKGGSSVEEMVAAQERLSRIMVDSSDNPKLVLAMQRLGISAETILRKDAKTGIQEIANSLENIPPSAQKTNDLFEVLGKSSGGLIVTLKELNSNIETFRSLGLGVKGDDIAKLKEATEAVEDMGSVYDTLLAKINTSAFAFGTFISKFTTEPAVNAWFDIQDWIAGPDLDLETAAEPISDAELKRGQFEMAKKNKEAAEAAAKLQTQIKAKVTEKELAEKDKLWEAADKSLEVGLKQSSTDKQRIDDLKKQEEILALSLKHVEGIDRMKWTTDEIKRFQGLADIRNERANLERKGDKLPEMKADSAIQIGNYLGSTLGTKQISLTEESIRIQRLIEVNTRYKQQPTTAGTGTTI